jgi:hypothetical protein
MKPLHTSFENVADWCERHLEDQRGREIGMLFGAMIRAYGQLASAPVRLYDDQRVATDEALNAKAEKFLLDLSVKFIIARGLIPTTGERLSKIVEPTSMITNMTYDPGKRPNG